MSAVLIHSAAEVPADFDVAVVLGKQLGVDSSLEDVEAAEDHLSYESRLNVIAAGRLWTPGRDILFSGNEKAYFPQAATEYIAKHFSHIPQDAYENPDTQSYDTLASADNVPPRLIERGYKKPLLVTVGFHAIRALDYFSRTDPGIDVAVASEDIVAERSAKDAEEIAAWKELPRIKREEKKERVLRSLDMDRKFFRFLMKNLRP